MRARRPPQPGRQWPVRSLTAAASAAGLCWIWALWAATSPPRPQGPQQQQQQQQPPPPTDPPYKGDDSSGSGGSSGSAAPPAAAPTRAPAAPRPAPGQARLPPLPYEYVLHRNLPSAGRLAEAQGRQLRRKADACADIATPPLPAAPRAALPPAASAGGADAERLAREFRFDAKGAGSLFADSAREALSGDTPWWVPATGNAPCTAEAQLALWRHQHPADCGASRFLVSRLKEGAHGLGSALSLVVHDLLSAVLLRRVLLIEPGRWFFAPGACGGRYQGWECYFALPTQCQLPAGVSVQTLHNGRDGRAARARAVRKKQFDVPGAGRNDLPPLSALVGGSADCERRVRSWVDDPANAYLMGTFARGADPLLVWAMAQALRYLLRGPQPWFSAAITANLGSLGYPQRWAAAGAVVFEQLRGEIAKFREYYNAFGCHDVTLAAYVNTSSAVLGRCKQGAVAYVSGNTPLRRYKQLRAAHEARGHSVWSTWEHPSASASAETARWGADSLLVSWVDFWAGVASTGWVCIVQSNWCRMINFLRLTAGRAECPFFDLGMRMLALPEDRRAYCIVRREWPKKPFSTVLRKDQSVLQLEAIPPDI
eukprot:TRINITY_DN12237_c0_g1_i1.p1 TRINITY_DN12237_c0_g1~~TRINITY_DN12237_c0_g1_i1.p1  ORF type:complete len:626 (+),score=154.08 TRINITY_DN12237_c0_g1_i1:86-1879(+)